jgi:hypothetical protein
MFKNFLSLPLGLKLKWMSEWLNMRGQNGNYMEENILNKKAMQHKIAEIALHNTTKCFF